MPDEPKPDGLLVIRATHRVGGGIEARITHGTAGEEPSLEIANVAGEEAIVALVRRWLQRLEA